MEEPLEILLEDAIEATPESVKNSVQSGLYSVGLTTAIKQGDEVLTDFGNLVAVKVHTGQAFVHDGNLGVVTLPALAVTNSVDHLSFDFTHGCLPLVDAVSIACLGAFCKRPCATLPTVPAPGPLVQAYYLDGQPDRTICAHCELIVPHKMRGFLPATLLLLHNPIDCVREVNEALSLFVVDLHCVKLESFEDKLETSNEEDGHK
jgi:hypothetical protein